jgi:hypothetical protein
MTNYARRTKLRKTAPQKKQEKFLKALAFEGQSKEPKVVWIKNGRNVYDYLCDHKSYLNIAPIGDLFSDMVIARANNTRRLEEAYLASALFPKPIVTQDTATAFSSYAQQTADAIEKFAVGIASLKQAFAPLRNMVVDSVTNDTFGSYRESQTNDNK